MYYCGGVAFREEKKYIFLQREEKGANLLVFSEKWLSRIQSFFNVSQFYWKIIAEFDARILHTRLICRSKIFLPLSALLWNIWAGAAVCLKLILLPKSDFFFFVFFAKMILKEKTIDWNWSVYVVLKNSIIVFVNCGKKKQNHFCDDRAVVCLDSTF